MRQGAFIRRTTTVIVSPVGKRLNFPRDASAEKVYRYTLSFRQKRDHIKEICHLWIVVFVEKDCSRKSFKAANYDFQVIYCLFSKCIIWFKKKCHRRVKNVFYSHIIFTVKLDKEM